MSGGLQGGIFFHTKQNCNYKTSVGPPGSLRLRILFRLPSLTQIKQITAAFYIWTDVHTAATSTVTHDTSINKVNICHIKASTLALAP